MYDIREITGVGIKIRVHIGSGGLQKVVCIVGGVEVEIPKVAGPAARIQYPTDEGR